MNRTLIDVMGGDLRVLWAAEPSMVLCTYSPGAAVMTLEWSRGTVTTEPYYGVSAVP